MGVHLTVQNNIVSYALENLKTFEELPFSEVDSVILSMISYLSFPKDCRELWEETGMVLKDLLLAEYFPRMTENLLSPEDTLLLLGAAAASPRFRNIRLCHYREERKYEIDKQFAAVTFVLEESLIYIAYRGTDSSLAGWKEDFDLLLNEPVPSQLEAVSYLNEVGSQKPAGIILGGHSKGGNLAVFAGAGCCSRVKDRIQQIYSHDGPGFSDSMLKRMDISGIEGKIVKTLPQSSMIGMMFEQECRYRIVRSQARGIGQHSPFTWIVKNNNFCTEDHITASAGHIYRSINDWNKNLEYSEKKRFIENVFRILEATGEESFIELGEHLQAKLPILLKEIAGMDDNTKSFFFHVFKELYTSSVKNIPETFHEITRGDKEKKGYTSLPLQKGTEGDV